MMPEAESPYCKTLPAQLRAWDASSLRTFMECPRKFQLRQLECWDRLGSIDLEFGSLYHHYVEQFDKALLAGASKEEATQQVMSAALVETIGTLETSYLPGWRCTSPAKVLGPRSGKLQPNKLRCPAAKALQLDGHREGATCPECGLATEDDWEIIATNKNKNRDTLLRTILFYCDTSGDAVKPWAFPDGQPAVELSFRLPLPFLNPDGAPYLLTGSMDGMIETAGEVIPRERKTTKNTPEGYFFAKYAPDVQIDTYDLAAWLLFSDLLDPKPHGVMVEVTQVTQRFTRIERATVMIPEERRAEWLQDLQFWISQAEACARADYWPKNTASCHVNGGCQFRDLCRMAPSSRSAFLPGEKYYKREPWNPLHVR